MGQEGGAGLESRGGSSDDFDFLYYFDWEKAERTLLT